MSSLAARTVLRQRALRPSQSLRCASTLTAGSSAATSTPSSLPPLSNIEASWKSLAASEQESVFKHLEELQKKDWNELSLDQKKAAYYVAFGPHGPREPILPPASGIKIFVGTLLTVGLGVGIFAAVRSFAPPPVHTITPEWEAATAERMRAEGVNPFTGYSSQQAREKAEKAGH